MFLIKTEQEFVNAFRPRDRKTLELPPSAKFPMVVRDYLAWVEPAGVRVFLVFQDAATQRPLGIAFRRDQTGEGAAPQMCDWCHAYGTSDEVALLTTEKNTRKRVGVGLCRDLRCGDRIEEAADRAGRNARDARKQLLQRMARFAREGLGIEGVPGDDAPAAP